MIRHVTLYRFRREGDPGQRAAFADALAAATAATGLASRLGCGEHIALPADGAVAESVYSFAAVWDFEDRTRLDEFSRHPAMQRFVTEHAAPLVAGLALANYEEPGPAPVASSAPAGTAGRRWR